MIRLWCYLALWTSNKRLFPLAYLLASDGIFWEKEDLHSMFADDIEHESVWMASDWKSSHEITGIVRDTPQAFMTSFS